MSKPDIEITRYGIIVIQSLREEDKKTGEELEREVLRYKEYLHENSFIDFFNIENFSDFKRTLYHIEETTNLGTIFTLHFEIHGDRDGIQLASGEFIPWKEFYDCIRPINIKLNNLLIIVMASCFGASLISYLDPMKRAPFLAFVGARRVLTEDEVRRAFSAFYQEYTNPLDIDKSMKAINFEIDEGNLNKQTFLCFTSEKLFDMTLDHLRDPVHFKMMVQTKLEEFNKTSDVQLTFSEMENHLITFLKDQVIKNKDFFCFKDVRPS